MMGGKNRSIRSQLFFMTFILFVVMTLVAFLLAYSYGRKAAQISYDRLLTGAALQISESVTMLGGEIVVDLPWSAFETLASAQNDRVFYQITDAENVIITGYADLPQIPESLVLTEPVTRRSVAPPVFYDAMYSGEPVRFVIYSRLFTETNYTGYVRIQIGQTMLARSALAEEITWRAIQLTVPFILVGFGLVLLGIRQLLKPVKTLNSALANRTAPDLTPLDVPVPAELQQLIDTINQFMQQLSSNLDQLKNFTSEAAHQLRTPLAGLRSQAQNALTEQDESLRTFQLNRVIESCDVLNHTVTQLLTRATLSHRLQSKPFEHLDLDELTQSVCRDIAVTALQEKIEISYSGSMGTFVYGDRFSLQQMFRNILENAIKYSPPDSLVAVCLTQHDFKLYRQILVEVRDHGPGIPDAEKCHVFERFYRSENNPRSGSGLGLAMAKEIADHHQATLELTDNDPVGLIVRINFSEYKG